MKSVRISNKQGAIVVEREEDDVEEDEDEELSDVRSIRKRTKNSEDRQHEVEEEAGANDEMDNEEEKAAETPRISRRGDNPFLHTMMAEFGKAHEAEDVLKVLKGCNR